MIGFNLVNLVIPNEPKKLEIKTKNGTWQIQQINRYEEVIRKIRDENKCAETYCATHQKKNDIILDELLFICLAASYLTSSAVTVKKSAFLSELQFYQIGDRFPRERGLSNIKMVVNSENDFKSLTSVMVDKFSSLINSHNMEVIIHHWLDSLSCWSLEDLYLSVCTILEIIKQNERKRTGDSKLYFFDAINSAAAHYRISYLSRDWINMRNDLIHDGKLSASRFSNKNKRECILVCLKVLNWIDEYVHAVFRMGHVKNVRFSDPDLELNSYTVY